MEADRAGRRDLDPAHGGGDRCVEALLEAEPIDVEGECVVLVGDGDADGSDVGDGGHGHASPYMSEPGVVRISPVSSQVFSPERIIGQPP